MPSAYAESIPNRCFIAMACRKCRRHRDQFGRRARADQVRMNVTRSFVRRTLLAHGKRIKQVPGRKERETENCAAKIEVMARAVS